LTLTHSFGLPTGDKVEAKGNYETAHRLRARIGSVFRYAVASGVAETDPTYALRDALIPDSSCVDGHAIDFKNEKCRKRWRF